MGEPLAEVIVDMDEEALELVGGLGAGLDRGASRDEECANLADCTSSVLRDHGGVLGEDRAGSYLSVDEIGLAFTTSTGTVRPVDLDHLDAVGEQEPSEPVAVGAGALDTGALDRAERACPSQQLDVVAVVCAERVAAEASAEAVEDDDCVNVLVGVDPECWHPVLLADGSEQLGQDTQGAGQRPYRVTALRRAWWRDGRQFNAMA
jgi:hypothetical protein